MVVEQTPSPQNRVGQQQFPTNHSSTSLETLSLHQQTQDIIQQQQHHQASHVIAAQHQLSKITSSPRPSILRKRDHEGSPMKASKNLIPILSATAAIQQQNVHNQQQQQHQQQQQMSVSPPPRPNSEGNDHSSGKKIQSTTFVIYVCVYMKFLIFIFRRQHDNFGNFQSRYSGSERR